MNIMQLLLDTGINAFGLKLLVESYNNLEPEVLKLLPDPLVIRIDGVKVILSKEEV